MPIQLLRTGFSANQKGRVVNIAYLVHDLDDAAVRRRVDMLVLGGAAVTVLGFRRGQGRDPVPGATATIDLGQTQDGNMVRRVFAVLAAAWQRRAWEGALDGATVVIARNLECLALAAPRRRARCPDAALVYECLDVHRLMLASGPVSRTLRLAEGWLLQACDTLVVSSMAFVRQYFTPRHGSLPTVLLMENCVLATERQTPQPRREATRPWRIGWFGVIRCARSLQLLADLVTALPGVVEVEIRGRVARDVLPDFDATVARVPGLAFLGPYDRRTDLPRLYGGVDFTWAMDFYEAGGNSDWLLPNRLYEGSLYGPVALALDGCETGDWLRRHDAGLILKEPLAASLQQMFQMLDAPAYAAARDRMAAISEADLVYGPQDCTRFVAAMAARKSVDRPAAVQPGIAPADLPPVSIPPASVPPASIPPVSIIVPALNEQGYIAACLDSLLAQRGCTVLEIIVADGGSTDETAALVRRMAQAHPQIRLIDNPGRLQSAGVNRAAWAADPRATVLVRADAHVIYPDSFVADCVTALAAQQATSVVVPMRTVGRTGFQRAVAAAQNSRLGNGGAAHRTAPRSGFVEHGHHAAFDRAFFTATGGYDESFSHNEDAELDVRFRRAGGRIWMCGSGCIDYFPRSRPWTLAQQYVRFGRGRARTILRHRLRPAPRQVAPVLLLPGLLACALLALAWPVFALVPLAYFGVCFAAGAAMALQRRDPWLLAAGPAANIMHLSFAWGFIRLMAAGLAGSPPRGRAVQPG